MQYLNSEKKGGGVAYNSGIYDVQIHINTSPFILSARLQHLCIPYIRGKESFNAVFEV